MKLQLEKKTNKTAVLIDPFHGREDRRFHPLVCVYVFSDKALGGGKKPIVVAAYAGELTGERAGQYSNALMIASFLEGLVKPGISLEEAYRILEKQDEFEVKKIVQQHEASLLLH